MPHPSTPSPPFDAWPLEIADERFGFAWYCGSGIIVTQATITHGTSEAAHAYHDYADHVLSEHAAEVQAAGGLYVIHDLRLLASYDSAARRAWTERMKRRRRGYLRGSTVVVAEATPLLRMAVSGISLMAAVSLGSSVDLSTDILETLARHGVKAPRRLSLRPLGR